MNPVRIACLALLVTLHAAGETPITPDKVITLFNGKDLSPFYTWLPKFGHIDPDRVFTIIDQIDGAPAIRVSGEHWGGFVTKASYANYKLVVKYLADTALQLRTGAKWGTGAKHLSEGKRIGGSDLMSDMQESHCISARGFLHPASLQPSR